MPILCLTRLGLMQHEWLGHFVVLQNKAALAHHDRHISQSKQLACYGKSQVYS